MKLPLVDLVDGTHVPWKSKRKYWLQTDLEKAAISIENNLGLLAKCGDSYRYRVQLNEPLLWNFRPAFHVRTMIHALPTMVVILRIDCFTSISNRGEISFLLLWPLVKSLGCRAENTFFLKTACWLLIVLTGGVSSQFPLNSERWQEPYALQFFRIYTRNILNH